MRDISLQFKKGSKELASIMYWRNVKVNCIICFMILAVVLYFTWPYVWGFISDSYDDYTESNESEGPEDQIGSKEAPYA